jgi:carboxyl-terminal processing protease
MNFRLTIFIIAIFIGTPTLRAQSKKELSRFDSIAHMSGRLVKKVHYTYSSFDDTFSKTLFDDFLESLDVWEAVFLQQDIEGLKEYETTLDDEFDGTAVRFCPEVEHLFRKRLKEAESCWTKLLSQPLDLNRKGEFLAPQDKKYGTYPANRDAQIERWRKWIILSVEKEMYTIQEIRTKKGVITPLADLEQQARAAVKRQLTGTWYRYLNKMTHEDYFSNYMKQFSLLLDAHTSYMDAKDELMYNNVLSGTVCGIGVTLQEVNGVMRIAALTPGGPAEQSGKIKVGDVLLSVKDGKGKTEDISGYTYYLILRIILGEEGTSLSLTCERPDGTRYTVSLNRAVITPSASVINTAVIEKNGEKIGYIAVPSFYEGKVNDVAMDIAQAIRKLNKEKVSGIVLDLRYNIGGLMKYCVSAFGEFFPYGDVVQVRNKKGIVSVMSDVEGMTFAGSVVVLVNPATISCGDVFTSMMQDFNRGLIMGATTAGKAVGQNRSKISDWLARLDQKPVLAGEKSENFGYMAITDQQFFSVTGRSIQLKGITPDVCLPDYRDYDPYRESSRKHPIPWDSIAPVKYKSWNFGFDIAGVKKQMQDDVNNNTTYQRIAANEAWLKQRKKEPVPLNWEEYVAFRKEEDMRITESEELIKLKNKMTVRLPIGENAQEQEGFLTKINTDLYISTAADAAIRLFKTK